MWRVFKRYSLTNYSYGGAPGTSNAALLPLDEIAPGLVAGIRTQALLEIVFKRRFVFAHALQALTSLDYFKSLMTENPETITEESTEIRTARKWKRHLRALQEFGILKKAAKGMIKCFARYFAVPKSDGCSSRAIFNGKRLSTFFRAPPTTNLPEIADVLRLVAEASFLIIGDYRHYFHQFGLHHDVSHYFGLQLGGSDVWRYGVLPMGWSWSPRLAQSASMTMLIEAAIRGKLVDPKDFEDLENPPSILKMRGGSAVVWYDNVLGAFQDADCRDTFYRELKAVCEDLHVEWKNVRTYNRKDMAESRATNAPDGTPLKEDEESPLPEYLGLEFANAVGKRQRDDPTTAKMKWRHRPSSLAKWKDLTTTENYKTPRAVARAVGVILWDATIALRPLCEESRALELMSKVGKTIRNNKWDEPLENCITQEDVKFLRDRIHDISHNNVFRTIDLHTPPTVVLCASDASNEGYGFVVWKGGVVEKTHSALSQMQFPKNLESAHIYIKEMYAAMQCIERTTLAFPHSTVRLAEDNSAVVWALRNGYSHNKISNEYIQRIHRCLSHTGCKLQVVPVPSKCNAADAPSRGWAYNVDVDAACREILEAFDAGLGKVKQTRAPAPFFTGGIRHEEPADLWMGWEEAPDLPESPETGGNSIEISDEENDVVA